MSMEVPEVRNRRPVFDGLIDTGWDAPLALQHWPPTRLLWSLQDL
jgi:hypothetical protein